MWAPPPAVPNPSRAGTKSPSRDRVFWGEWDLRSLVGHTSRSVSTVSTYLQQPAEGEDITTPQEYYARVNPAALGIAPAGIVERGRLAGRDLGDDPAARVDELVSLVPTRTFELAVQGLDIARAVGISFALPADVLDNATALAARRGRRGAR
jgi:hypothetical protein